MPVVVKEMMHVPVVPGELIKNGIARGVGRALRKLVEQPRKLFQAKKACWSDTGGRAYPFVFALEQSQ